MLLSLLICYQLRKDIQQYIRDLCKWKGVEIIEGKMMPDHVHLLLSIPPKYSVSSFMGYLKGKSAMMIFEKHGNLKYKFGSKHFGTTGVLCEYGRLQWGNSCEIHPGTGKTRYARRQIDYQRIRQPFQGLPVISPLRPPQSESQPLLGAGFLTPFYGVLMPPVLRVVMTLPRRHYTVLP